MKKIYIVMMVLPTFINKLVYCLTGFEYTHFSLALEKDLNKLYSFQIKNKSTTLVGGFMEEEQVFYFHGKKDINANDYAIPDNVFFKNIKFTTAVKKSFYSIKESICRVVLQRKSKKI